MSGALDGKSRMKGGLWGSLVGDALGVPVKFEGRAAWVADPVLGMRGYGTHRQPAGTWSDDGICSGGYVIDTLEAAVWCLVTSDDFGLCVIKAVNLGGDTDTTGCVTGGLAGVL